MPEPKSRPASSLSPALSRQLNAYALAAGAAGVGLLALPQPAEGEVVYTPVHVVLTGSSSIYVLDVNNDGTWDFSFSQWYSVWLGIRRGGLNAGVAGSFPLYNGMEVGTRRSVWALALDAGAPISAKKNFYGCNYFCYPLLAYSASDLGQQGHWNNVSGRYLGLKFYADGHPYFGWARISVLDHDYRVSVLLTGYAYENVPNHPIRAGQISGTFDDPEYGQEPSASEIDEATSTQQAAAQSGGTKPHAATLGRLALGAAGVSPQFPAQ